MCSSGGGGGGEGWGKAVFKKRGACEEGGLPGKAC